jgi:alpha-tubulin suppressor-like RCC1 family protein
MRTMPAQVVGALRFAQLSAGPRHTCGITTAGSAYCWGNNYFGELGNGTTANSATPAAVAGGLTFAVVSAGNNHTCGVTTAGLAYCWGNGAPVGDGVDTAHLSLSPVAVVGGHSFVVVSAGGDHTCGVTTTNLAYCWGYNEAGQLGDGTRGWNLIRSSPVSVLGGLRFAAISAGMFHTCGVTTAGAAYCWGDNSFGTLGDGTIDSSFVPAPVAP